MPLPARVERQGIPPRQTRGYALLEVLATLLISLLALGALVRFQGDLFRSDGSARARSQAVLLAEQRLEALQGELPAAAPDIPLDGTDTWSVDLAPADAADATYTRSWNIAADAATGTFRIEVVVAWNDAAGRGDAVRLASLIDPVAVGHGSAAATYTEFIRLE